jgi:hypothetical protein
MEFQYLPEITYSALTARLAKLPYRSASPDIVGVCDTGSRSTDGATLAYIDAEGNVIDQPDAEWYENHPAFNFVTTQVGSDYLVRVPVAWWKRGVVPAGKTYAGNWAMWLAKEETTGFSKNPYVFKDRSGNWVDEILYGKYRINTSNNSAAGTAKASTSFNGFQTIIAGKGALYGMTSMQEYHEVLARAVIEKGTFQLWPESVRGTVGATDYRGIIDMAYGPAGGIYAEFRDGIRINATSEFEAFDDDGSRSYVNTGVTAAYLSSGNFITSLLAGDEFDFMFVAASVGAVSAAMIPDQQQANAECVLNINLSQSNPINGAFYLTFSSSPSGASGIVSARLSRLPD